MTILSATVQKDTKDVKTGIRLNTKDGIVQIKEIAPSSLFAKCGTPLHPGMHIVSVNDKPCDNMTPKEVTQIIRDAVGTVVVSVDDEIVEPVKAELISNDLSNNGTAASVGANRPPPGVASGGTWGISTYFGQQSCVCAFILCVLCPPFCCYVACCPFDEKDAYMINRKVRRNLFY